MTVTWAWVLFRPVLCHQSHNLTGTLQCGRRLLVRRILQTRPVHTQQLVAAFQCTAQVRKILLEGIDALPILTADNVEV